MARSPKTPTNLPTPPEKNPEPHRPWGVHVMLTRPGEARTLGPYASHGQALTVAKQVVREGFTDGNTEYGAAAVFCARVSPE